MDPLCLIVTLSSSGREEEEVTLSITINETLKLALIAAHLNAGFIQVVTL